MKNDILKVAIQLARMYGVAKTLNPVKYLDSLNFVTMILEWSNDFMREEEQDIVAYFEKQFSTCKRGN